MYEYVKRNEYQPVRELVEEIIRKAQKILRQKGSNNDITFQYKLIGSGNKHLITRIKDGNKGWDFDYNLILRSLNGETWNAEPVKKHIFEAFRQAIKGTAFNKIEDSTSAITIKCIDNKHSLIKYSVDFAIVDQRQDGTYLLTNNKMTGKYVFEKRGNNFICQDDLNEIKQNGYWDILKEKYLYLKNINTDINKHSRSILLEAINNLYNEYEFDEDEDDYDYDDDDY